MDLHLLLQSAGAPLPGGPSPFRLSSALDEPTPVFMPEPSYLRDPAHSPDSLARQRWALVVPTGTQGERLRTILAPLCRQRASQQGAEVEVFQVPAGMDARTARRFREDVMQPASRSEREQARYVLLAGDPHSVSLELQEELAADGFGFVGRLAFEKEEAYESYVAKVLKTERAPARDQQARALFLAVDDGSLATTVGRDFLVSPLVRACQRDRKSHYLRVTDIVHEVQLSGSAERLLRLAALPEPAVLFTMSHGLGAPSGGWADVSEQRQRQGRMCLGEGLELSPDEVGRGAFVPGGMWFYFACFSAGTPARSCYWPWMERLRQAGEISGDALERVWASRPVDGRPFVAELPQAALANPDGPLAIIAHQDLAWTYAFYDAHEGRAHPGPFVSALTSLLEGHRAGVAVNALRLAALKADSTIQRQYQADEEASLRGQNKPTEALNRGHLWMERHDLMSYTLLGDPAAKLAVDPDGEQG